MHTITQKAQLIAQDMNGHALKPSALDPALIGSIISVIMEAIQAFIACKKTPQQTQAAMARGGPVEKAALRQAIRKHTQHVALRSPMLNSSLKIGSSCTVDDVEEMMQEVQR